MEVQLTTKQAIETLSLVREKLVENKKIIEEARNTRGGPAFIEVMEKYNDDLVTIREKITAQLEFDDVVQM